MNVQQLRYLVAVGDAGSVSAAARSLNVTQPVISRSIRAFEFEHDVTVFGRSGRRLVPTEAGMAVVESARRALAAIDDVGHTARAAGDHVPLAIATTPTNGLLLALPLSDLGRCEPTLEIRLCRAGDSDDVLQRVRSGDADIGFGELSSLADDDSLTSTHVADVEVVLVSPIGSDLPAAVSWDDVLAQPLILPPAGSGRRQLFDGKAARAAGRPPHAALVIEDRGSWIAAAQAGMGSFLSYRPVVTGLERVEIRPFEPTHVASVGFIHRVGPVSPAATRLMDLARASYAGSSPIPAG
jgi:DNA-binding transcriptional LysR family regulator